jgi:hypothetical protein
MNVAEMKVFPVMNVLLTMNVAAMKVFSGNEYVPGNENILRMNLFLLKRINRIHGKF